MTTEKKPTDAEVTLKELNEKDRPSVLKAMIRDLKVALAEKDCLITEKDEQIEMLIKERDVLTTQLAKMSSRGDQEKERLVSHLLKKHPGCFEDLEYNDAFDEATKK